MLYTNISKLPLSIFIDCLVDDNTKSLVISGEHSEDELAEAWDNIQDQYADAMANTDRRTFLKLLKEINIIAMTLNQAKTLIEVLYDYYHEELALDLNKVLSSQYKFDPYDRPAYEKQLKVCEVRMKGLEMQLEIKTEALESLQNDIMKKGNTKPSRQYFSKMLNLLEEHFTVPVDENITVSRYCDKINRMSDQLKSMKYERTRR
jgi:hypothetical protein